MALHCIHTVDDDQDEGTPPKPVQVVVRRRATKRRLVIELKDVLESEDERKSTSKRPRKQFHPKKSEPVVQYNTTATSKITEQHEGKYVGQVGTNSPYGLQRDDTTVEQKSIFKSSLFGGEGVGADDNGQMVGRLKGEGEDHPVGHIVCKAEKINHFTHIPQHSEEDKENTSTRPKLRSSKKTKLVDRRRSNRVEAYKKPSQQQQQQQQDEKEDIAWDHWNVLTQSNILRQEDAANRNLSYICDENLTSKEIRFRLRRHTRRTLAHCGPPRVEDEESGDVTSKHSYLATTSTSKDSYDHLKNTSKIIRMENMKRRLHIGMNDHPDRTTIKDRLRSSTSNTSRTR